VSSGRLVLAVVATLLASGVLVTATSASTSVSRPAGAPDLAAMALAVHDLPAGTRVDKQGYVRDPDYVASYTREFSIRGSPLGRSLVLGLEQTLEVERTAAEARATLGFASRLFRGRQGAQLLKSLIVEGGVDARDVVVRRIRTPSIGHGALVIPIRVTVDGVAVELAVVLFRFDRVLGTLTLVGLRIRGADTDRLARVAASRVRAGLLPTSTAAPTLSGTPQPGQVLTATRGAWRGDQLAYAYQWERCDAAGAGCVAITGAIAPTHTVSVGDLGSTLRARVTGRNRLGSASATSGASPVVAGPAGAPTSAAAPVISGSVQVGATLTATTGSWTGEPTSYAYQWRRCDAAGAGCVDIAGATAAAYVVSSADSRLTLRVLVVAANAAGPGGAVSAATAAVP
jgi:hypothetical protein